MTSSSNNQRESKNCSCLMLSDLAHYVELILTPQIFATILTSCRPSMVSSPFCRNSRRQLLGKYGKKFCLLPRMRLVKPMMLFECMEAQNKNTIPTSHKIISLRSPTLLPHLFLSIFFPFSAPQSQSMHNGPSIEEVTCKHWPAKNLHISFAPKTIGLL